MSRSSCGTRVAETFIAIFSATTPVTSWRSAETTPTEPGTNTRRFAGLQVLDQRLGTRPRPRCRRRAGPGSCLRVAAKVGSAASVSRTRSVSIQVGCALATVTPRWATSSRSASPNRSRPAFAAQ